MDIELLNTLQLLTPASVLNISMIHVIGLFFEWLRCLLKETFHTSSSLDPSFSVH